MFHPRGIAERAEIGMLATSKEPKSKGGTLVKLQNRGRLALVLCGTLAASFSASAQNPVNDWNNIAITSALAASQVTAPGSNTQAGSSPYLAYVHLAIYDAVNAIDHRCQSLRRRHFRAGGRVQGSRCHRGGVSYARIPVPRSDGDAYDPVQLCARSDSQRRSKNSWHA